MAAPLALAILVACLALFPSSAASGDDLRGRYESKFPPQMYIVGIGEARRTGNDITDYRIAEVVARRDVAQQVRVEVTSVDVDYACSGAVGVAYGGRDECRDEFISIIQTATHEFLAGSRIVDRGSSSDSVYVVVVMPRTEMAEKAMEARDKAIEDAREGVKEAGKGRKDAQAEARESLLKAKAYDKQARSMGDIRDSADELFRELDAELGKM